MYSNTSNSEHINALNYISVQFKFYALERILIWKLKFEKLKLLGDYKFFSLCLVINLITSEIPRLRLFYTPYIKFKFFIIVLLCYYAIKSVFLHENLNLIGWLR